MVSEDEKLFADLWMKQIDLFLRIVAVIPIAEFGLLVGWYKLISDGQSALARMAALLGVVVMLMIWAILHRTVRYIRYFRSKIESLAGGPSPTLVSRWIGTYLPVICVIVNVILAGGLIEPKPHPSPQVAPHSN